MTLAYSVNLSATLVGVTSTVTPGTLLVRLGGLYAASTTANRSGGLRTEAVALTGGSTISVKEAGTIPPTISGLGTGLTSWVRASATGFCERIASPSTGDDVIGWCETDGTVHLLFSAWTPALITGASGGGGGGGGTTTNIPPGFIDPEFYGAVGDGVTNDQAKFDLAMADIAAGTYKGLWLHAKTYLLTTGVAMPDKTTIRGQGQSSILKSNTATTKMVTASAVNDITIADLRIEFNFAGSAQIGVQLGTAGVSSSGPLRALVRNVTVYRASDKGFTYTNNPLASNTYSGPSFLGCEADTCNIGFYCSQRGEYMRVTGCQASLCTYGLYLDSGNFNITGCTITGCTNNVYITNGTNDAHGVIDSCNINHATSRSVYVGNIVNGQVFSNCKIYSQFGAIECAGSAGVVFQNCVVDVSSMITGTGTNGCGFDGCQWPGGYANTFAETAGYLFFFTPTNRKLDGSIPASAPDLRTRAMTTNTLSTQIFADSYAADYWQRVRVGTTDATTTNGITWTITNNCTTTVTAIVDAVYNDGSLSASFVRRTRIRCQAGSFNTYTVETSYTDAEGASSALVVTIDNSGFTGRVRITGIAATSITWKVTLIRSELLHP